MPGMKTPGVAILSLLLWSCSHPPTQPPPAVASRSWMEQVDRRIDLSHSGVERPPLGSQQWMRAIGRASGVIDAQGHGPDPGSTEWLQAVDRKLFGSHPEVTVTYHASSGEQLEVVYDNRREVVMFSWAERRVTLPQVISASGARYSRDEREVFWSKGKEANYWIDGQRVFHGQAREWRSE